VVVVRNANTGDFVLPAGGDPSAASTSPDQAANKATPLYVVARTDIVRIYVEIPEEDANYVTKGTKAAVEVRALQNDPLPGTVTRTSWALHLKSRTLRAEIDLPNKDSKLLPGMYAYGKVLIERENVLVVPRSTVIELGEQQYCYFYDNGKAVRVAVQTGIGDDLWVEVTGKQLKTEGPNLTRWADLTGDEQLIDGDLTELSDGESVKITS
jgi:HlyD family secretion protein